MNNVIVVNATPQETRVAILEEGTISGFHHERRKNRGVVGNVYHGRVVRVLPGMEAAFVDIGLEKAAFLHVSDVYNDHSRTEIPDPDDDGNDGSNGSSNRGRRRKNYPPIEKQLNEGQQLLVQVLKDPISTKGARITCHISIPGRHLVYMPTVERIGISRQIKSNEERSRLRELAEEMRPEGTGYIVRTASEGVSSDVLRKDMELLISIWNEIYRRSRAAKPPRLVYTELDLVLRATRDLAAVDLTRLVIDDREQYERIMNFVERFMPHFVDRIELYVGSDPIFDAFGIEAELRRALDRKVELPSGGSLIIEPTEALTSIDINTGRYVGSNSLDETILQTNLEAAREIAYQLRLRNIGGLIIIDFIDMQNGKHRKKVTETLQKVFKDDPGRVKISKISEFGLVEMTRKRTSESILHMLCEECEHCDGRGVVRSAETVAYELIRQLRRKSELISDFDVQIVAHPRVANLLLNEEYESVHELELQFNKKFHIHGDNALHPEDYEIATGSHQVA
jgi:ribonuclease G